MSLSGNLPDGTEVQYDEQTIFLIQTSRGRGSYSTLYAVTGDLERAVQSYTGVVLRVKGSKKRLVLPRGTETVLLREAR
jgi:hypothetical protein